MNLEPRRNKYVGHRYVPNIMGEWSRTNTYEGLSIVTYEGASYTSKKHVPAGVDIKNDEYWVLTGNYNAQIEYYRKETENVSNQLSVIEKKTDDNKELINTKTDENRALINGNNRVLLLSESKDIAGDINNFYQSLKDGETLKVESGTYTLNKPITLDKNVNIDMTGVTLLWNGLGFGVTVGDENKSISSKNFILPSVKKIGGINWQENKHGIRVLNIYNSEILFNDVEGFKKGIVIEGMNSLGNSYSNYTFKRVVNNQKSLTLTSNNKGWSNENNFYSGRFGYTSDIASLIDENTVHVHVQYIDYSQNNIRFNGVSFESGAKTGKEKVAEIEDGRMIYFRDCRFEGIRIFDIKKGTDIQVTNGFGVYDLEFINKQPNVLKSHFSSYESKFKPFMFRQSTSSTDDIMHFFSGGSLSPVASIKGDGSVELNGHIKASKGLVFADGKGLIFGSSSPIKNHVADAGNLYYTNNGRLYTKTYGANNSDGWTQLQPVHSNTSSGRPLDMIIGYQFFDITLNKPIWHKGDNVWVDADGTTV